MHLGDKPEPPKRLLFGEEINRLTLAEIAMAIVRRQQQIRACVGTLYPAIMADEIGQLEARRQELL